MIEVNLLPEELRKNEEKINLLAELPIQRWAIICVIGFIAFQLLGTAFVFFQSARFKTMSVEIKTLTNLNKETTNRKAETILIRKRINNANNITQRPFAWNSLLSSLSDSVTKGVWLTNFVITGDEKIGFKLRLEGSVVGRGEETSYTGKFIKELKSVPIFNEFFDAIELSNLNQSRIKDIDVYNFVILCTFKKGMITQ